MWNYAIALLGDKFQLSVCLLKCLPMSHTNSLLSESLLSTDEQFNIRAVKLKAWLMKSFTIFFFISQICVKGILLLSFHSFDTIYYEKTGNTISVLAAIPSVDGLRGEKLCSVYLCELYYIEWEIFSRRKKRSGARNSQINARIMEFYY